jgi:hypothetical protein
VPRLIVGPGDINRLGRNNGWPWFERDIAVMWRDIMIGDRLCAEDAGVGALGYIVEDYPKPCRIMRRMLPAAAPGKFRVRRSEFFVCHGSIPLYRKPVAADAAHCFLENILAVESGPGDLGLRHRGVHHDRRLMLPGEARVGDVRG